MTPSEESYTFSSVELNETTKSSFTASHFSWVVSPFVAVVFVISIIGSIFIFCLVCASRTFRRTSNYLVANLCVASIYHIAVSILYNMQSGGLELWKYGPTTCYIVAFVHRLSTPVLPLTIAALSLDRSVVARNPLDFPSKGQAAAKVVGIWAFSITLLIPRASMSMYDESVKHPLKCRKVLLWNSVLIHVLYAAVTLVVIYIIPTYILLKEFVVMRCQMKFLMMSQVEQRKRFYRRIRVMKNACIFTLLFVTCWLPQGLTQFPFDLPDGHFFSQEVIEFMIPLRDFFRQLSIFNTCLTPIILLALSFDMREFLTSCYV